MRLSASQYPKTIPITSPVYLVSLQDDDEEVTASGITLTGRKTYIAMIFINDETIAGNYQTNPDAEAAAIMILLNPGYFCWLIGNARVKTITQ